VEILTTQHTENLSVKACRRLHIEGFAVEDGSCVESGLQSALVIAISPLHLCVCVWAGGRAGGGVWDQLQIGNL
jgi:hypothetical protein